MKKVIGGIEVPVPGGLVHWQPLYQRQPDRSPPEADNVSDGHAKKGGIFERVERRPDKPKS